MGNREIVSGILNIDKPSGLTSHDVVNRIRRASGQRRVGHAGTLDPVATGVLLVCLGGATRVVEYLVDGPKRYRATALLGTTTDTYDREGRILSQVLCPDLKRAEVEVVLQQFVGRIDQVPPMYSAIKVKGQRLYKLARRGITLEREPRVIEVHWIKLVEWSPPGVTFEVECSKGTYIRALAHDLGRELGCGAHLTDLVRLASGSFTITEAVPLEEIEKSFVEGLPDKYLLPLDMALQQFPAVNLSPAQSWRVGTGSSVRLSVETSASLCRAYDSTGNLIALLVPDAQKGLWRPRKVLRQVFPSNSQ